MARMSKRIGMRNIVGRKQKKTPFSTVESQKTLHKNLEFTAAEQYKLLRTNLQFTISEDVKCPILGITSSMRGEGKSTTAVNLSYALAEGGKKVLLIDGDLRIPSIAKKMRLDNSVGLTTLLYDKEAFLPDVYRSRHHDNWYILPSGVLPPNPSELLGSRRMGRTLDMLKEHFDVIVVDLPPVNLVSDALAISKYLTGMILVIREEHTEKRELEDCVRQLKLSNINVLGCVLNGCKTGGTAYTRYKQYHSYDDNPSERK